MGGGSDLKRLSGNQNLLLGMEQDLIMKQVMTDNNLKESFSVTELEEKDIENKIKAFLT